MATLEITIDDLGAQGDGIAHDKGATIFVEGTLSGEKVRVELKDDKSLVKRAKLLEVLIPSSQRAEPCCPHYGQCGGCRFQHMDDSSYSAFKLNSLVQILSREKLPLPPIMPIVVTATQTRRRARLAAKHLPTGMIVGFNAWRSHEIVDVKICPVMKPEIVDMIDKLRSYLAVWLPLGESCDIQVTALAEGLDVLLIGGPRLEVEQRQDLSELSQQLNVAHLSWRKWDRSPVEPIAHHFPLNVRIGNQLVPFPPGSFLQATQAGEEALVNFVCTADQKNVRALDLFCGLGTFGLALENVKSVHFCDLDGPAIESLKNVAKSNARYSVSLKNLAVDPFTSIECNDFDLVIFDPPRGGAKAQAVQLAKSRVPCVMAISCDPPSFARDAKILIDGGYTLEKILPVDQFLWSSHLEIAAMFTR